MNPTKNLETLKIIASDMCSYLQDKLSDVNIVTVPRIISNKIVFTVDKPIPHYDSGLYETFRTDIEKSLQDKFESDEYTIDVKLRDKSGISNGAWKTVITGVIVTLASTAKYEFENPLKSLSFRWGSSVKKTERVKDITDIQRVMDSFVSLLNEKINWALEQPKKRLPVKGYILVNYKQEQGDNSYFTPVLVWECRKDKIYAAAVDAVGYEYETQTNKFRKIGTSLDLNLLNGSNLYDFTSHQFNLEYQGDVPNTKYVTESIYKLMDQIDDKESLNEKYNVKDQHELKKLQKSLNEAVRPTERKYKFKYIADDDAPYLEMGMTDEEIDYAFDNNKFPPKMWLEGEAVVTTNKDEDYGTFYEVSWTDDMSDYIECSTIAECKKAVEEYGTFYKIRWIKDKTR